MKWILNDDGSATCDSGKAWYVIRTKFVVERIEDFGGDLTNTGSVVFKDKDDAKQFVKRVVDNLNKLNKE